MIKQPKNTIEWSEYIGKLVRITGFLRGCSLDMGSEGYVYLVDLSYESSTTEIGEIHTMNKTDFEFATVYPMSTKNPVGTASFIIFSLKKICRLVTKAQHLIRILQLLMLIRVRLSIRILS